MINKLSPIAAALMLTLASAHVYAQDDASKQAVKDSVPDNKEVKNRNVMLNASADNQPRQISIGLPAEMSATIYEDGSPVSWTWWPMLPYFYWAGGPQYGRIGVQSLSESAITNGAINYGVDCWMREGGDKFLGLADYTTNSHGLQRFDVSLSGPIKNGWSYAVSAYANLDPGNNKLKDVQLVGNMRQVMAGLTKHFDKGSLSLNYKYSTLTDKGDATGPFYYEGDGSVKQMPGFDLGKDGYLPADQQLTYMDVVTGQMRTISRQSRAMSQDLSLVFKYHLRPNMEFDFMSKYHYANVHYAGLSLAGIGTAGENSPYTYASATGEHKAGDVFTGDYQTRYLMVENGYERAWYNTAELKGFTANRKHNWRVGANIWWMLPKVDNSSSLFTHTVEKDPVWLYLGGNQSFGYNSGGEYYDFHELKTALYATDDWQATDRLWLSAGLRLEYYTIGGRNAMAWGDTSGNTIQYENNLRTNNWSLKHATITRQKFNNFNPAATLSARYTLAKGFGLMAQAIYTKQAAGSPNYAGPNMPNTDAINTYFAQGGLFWNTPWMKLVSQLSFIKKTNYQRNVQFTNPNNSTDVVTLPTTYAVQTIGWTTDVVLTPFKGFNFHGLLTLQSPKFKDFDMAVTFSDGTTNDFSFNDNYTTGVSKVLIELDPSYAFSKFRVWASFRYFSKQYINRTNSLTFNGRWETFAGLDYTLNKHVSFGLNFVNLLNQKGASGSITSADLVTDTTPFKHYLMSGSYIRPFTVELAAHINF